MTLTDARLDRLLAYCKLTELKDDPEVQLLIPGFYADAVNYLAEAGVTVPEEGSLKRATYDLCVDFMVLDAWDHRDTKEPSTFQENPSFRRRVNQLKMGALIADVSESDTSQ